MLFIFLFDAILGQIIEKDDDVTIKEKGESLKQAKNLLLDDSSAEGAPKRPLLDNSRRQREQTSAERKSLAMRSSSTRRKRPQLDCTLDDECYNGQFCAQDVGKCFDEGHGGYKEKCLRDGGKHNVLGGNKNVHNGLQN